MHIDTPGSIHKDTFDLGHAHFGSFGARFSKLGCNLEMGHPQTAKW